MTRTSYGALVGALLALACAIITASCLDQTGANPGLGSPEGGLDTDGGAPVVSVNGATQGFGAITLGASSTPTSIVVTNTGTASTGLLQTSVGGANAAEFPIDADTCTGKILPPASACSVSLHFAPTAPGTATATFLITATPGGSLSVQLTGTAATPGALAISPATNDYGPVVVGSVSATTAFVVTNGGGSATGPLTASLLGTDRAQFATASDTCTGHPLAAGATCAVAVAFSPTAPGTKSASLSVGGTPGGTANAALGGTAITGGALALTPATQDFGSVVVGATSAPQAFTLTNTGGAPTGATFGETFTGVNGAEFAVQSTTCAAALAPGASCAVTVTFTPKSSGAKTATLDVGASPGGTAAATLTATGLAPAALAMTPATQGFGSVVVGQQSADGTFSVTNPGQALTGALTVQVTGAGFALDKAKTTCAAALGPGATCAVAVTFKPTAAGSATGGVTVQGTPGGTASATLTGTGLTPGALAIAPATFPFAPTLIGQTTAAQTFTVTNTGGGATGTLTASLTGSGASQFKIGADGCSTKSLTGAGTAGASCTVTVAFAPTASGAPTASLVVSSAGSGGSTAASINGTGEAPAQLAWGAATYTAPLAATGASSTVTVVLGNTGDVASGAPTFAFTGANKGDFSVPAASCAGGIAAHSACSMTATFTPKTAAGEAATLTATAAPGGSAPTTLNGTGATPASFTITPSSFPFGSFVVGTTGATQSFAIKNVGGVAAGSTKAVALASTGTNKGDFLLSASTCPAVLNAGASCTVNVTYKPTVTGAESASLSVTATAGGTQTAALTGTGLTAGKLATDTPSFAFAGPLVIGTPSAEKVITVSNTGGGATSALGMSINGGAASPFKIDGAKSTCAGASLAGAGSPGSSCTVVVFYDPTASGPQSDTLTVTAATGGTVTSSLSGTGETPAALTLTSTQGASVAFGSYVDGTSSAPVTFTIGNTGQQASGAVTVGPFGGANAADFAVVTPLPGCLSGIAGGGTCQLSIIFTPSIVGSESAQVAVSAAPGGTSAAVALHGTGFSTGPELQISPLNAALGNVLFVDPTNGGIAGAQTFTITNVGGAATGALTDSLTGSADFSASNYPARDFCGTQTLAANGGSCVILVTYTSPSVGAVSSATLTVSEPTGTSDTVSATISATAVANGNPLTVTSSGGMGGACIVGDAGLVVSGDASYTIKNSGAVPTGPLTIQLAFDPFGQFVIVPGTDQCSGQSLAPGGTCSYDVQFQTPNCPSSVSTMTITDGNGDQLTVEIEESLG